MLNIETFNSSNSALKNASSWLVICKTKISADGNKFNNTHEKITRF